jgi:hypothetical protein
MRLSRFPAVLVAAALSAGIVSCATTVDGTGTLAADVSTGSAPSPTDSPSTTSEPTPDPTTDSPTPEPTTPAPTTDPVQVKRRLLCVLERAAITSINSQFNKSKDRDGQIRILRTGATTIKGHIAASKLSPADGIRKAGQSVLDQLNRLVADASGGNSPSTGPYNAATTRFQTACNKVS